jgi:NTP pyrophosphatase (non-canonical NTP hydrolase)
MNDHNTTLEQVKAIMREFVGEREWHKYHTPKNLTMAAACEVGELMELFQWLTAEESTEKLKDPAFKKAVGEELTDSILFLMSFATACDIDIASAVQAKMEKNRKKYPKEKFKGHYERPLPK